MEALRCPVCSRNGFKRLTRHLSQVHGISKKAALAQFPGLALEVQPDRVPVCSVCGEEVPGASPRAAYVKCEECAPKDSREKVACELCGEERRRLRAHLKSAHGLTPAQYQARFPGTLVEVPGTRERSKVCREKQSAAATERWKDPVEREAQSDRLQESAPWKDKSLSPEHRQAISEGCTGKVLDLSDEERARRGEQGRRVLTENLDRPSHSSILSAAQKRRLANGEKLGFQNPETLAKAHATARENGPPKGAGRGICGFRKGLDHYTRSTLEANFARLLVAMGVPYQYEPQCFKIKLADGRETYYTPDFYLEEPLKIGERLWVPAGWVEIKGWRHKDGRLPGNAQEKLDALRLLVDEPVSVLVGGDPEWTALRAMWRPIVPQWETQTRNLRTHPEFFSA